MLRYRLVCVGRRAKDPLLDAADDYLHRLGRYAKVELTRIKDSQPAAEAREIAAKLHRDDHVVVLDERGEQLTTRQLAGRVEAWQQGHHRAVALLIGGAAGLDPSLGASAREVLALSNLTLPHRLALALLCEQLYRAHTILRGEPYHRD